MDSLNAGVEALEKGDKDGGVEVWQQAAKVTLPSIEHSK